MAYGAIFQWGGFKTNRHVLKKRKRIKGAKRKREIKRIINAPLPTWTQRHPKVRWLADLNLLFRAKVIYAQPKPGDRGDIRGLVWEAESYFNDPQKRPSWYANDNTAHLKFKIYPKRFYIDKRNARRKQERRDNRCEEKI